MKSDFLLILYNFVCILSLLTFSLLLIIKTFYNKKDNDEESPTLDDVAIYIDYIKVINPKIGDLLEKIIILSIKNIYVDIFLSILICFVPLFHFHVLYCNIIDIKESIF